MLATGRFEVELTPQEDGDAPAGRMLLRKGYKGHMSGSAVGQMISKRIDNGPAVYYAIEEFSGTLGGRAGAFTLLHQGRMSSKGQSLEVTVLEGSGSGELAAISGSMAISQDESGHRYRLEYEV
jgi:hypothetical protein